MVDVTEKAVTDRVAVARGSVSAHPETLRRIRDGEMAKGDVLQIARLAGIMGAKRTSELIPLCHPLPLSGVEVDLSVDEDNGSVRIEAQVRVTGRTGVEMEALTAVSVAALTVYDMCKSIDRGMRIPRVELVEKRGGKSGTFIRENGDT